MKYLLDTHTFLWWDMQAFRLSSRALALCQDKSNTLLLSMASLWEIQIKQQLGTITLSAPLGEIVEKQRKTNGIELLPIEPSHILGVASLPDYSKDPFDCLLVSQAKFEELSIISNDARIAEYAVRVVW